MSMLVMRFLTNRGVVEVSHPPYSPDLAPATFFNIPQSDNHNQRTYEDIEDIKMNLTAELHAFPWNLFDECFVKHLREKLCGCCRKRRLL
jgi:hypothetical protein